MTTITNNKLPEWRTALDKCVENYQSTRAWYEENRDSPAALDDMERAEDQLANFVKKYGFSIVLSLLDEIDDLQELRRSCLALRGEIEDVQAQLYEAENRNNADDEELQERRKADSDPVGEFYEDGPLNWYQISVSGPVVPEEITSASAPEIFEIAAEAERLGLRGSYASYAVGWNACRAAMLQGKTSAVRAPKSGEVSCG
ncbi:hypothetical protein NAK90_002097 [Salmonella enterica]|nr:hypothetical protein [Salmonella enterica subsp. enterica]EJG7678647.1 hypothetical protein [Salmonella enterica]HAF1585170.1 hypothetical protein [Salmonella enterica]